MNALVLGGAAATGPLLIEGLVERGYEVTVLHRGVHEAEESPNEEHIHADPHFLESLQDALKGRTFDVVVGTYGRLRLTAEAMKGHTSRLITVGGAIAIYKGWMRITERHPQIWFEVSPVPVKEDHPLATAPGVDHFNEKARAAEHTVMQAHEEGHYSVSHFRYPIVYGPRNVSPQEWSVVRRIRDGRKHIILPGGGRTLVSRGYAENMAHALLLAVDKPEASAGQIYNICDESFTFTNREWVGLIAQVMGHDLECIEIPFDMLPPAFGDAPPILGHPYHQVLDLTKIKEQLGYRDVVGPEEGMRRTVKWLAAHPLEPGCEMEQFLGDPFNYEAEDRLIDVYRTEGEALRQRLRQVAVSDVQYEHPYAHPSKPGDLH